MCNIWEELPAQASVRTHLTSTIDPKEKAELLVAISHFKQKQ